MIFILFLELLAFSVFLFIVYHVVKYRNPFKLYMVFGKKGSGKTTLMTKLAYKYEKKGWTVYSDTEIPGVRVFRIDDFGNYQFDPRSCILIDEVGLIWDNRNFKNFPERVKVYFKYQRQYRCVCYLFSQSFDIDKKIRDLTDHLYIVQNFFNCFSIARRVTKKLTVVHADRSAQGESKIVDDYNIDPLWQCFFGSVIVTYIPHWAQFFKSFDPPRLPPYPYTEMPTFEFRSGPRALAAAAKERMLFLRKMNRD